MRELGILDLMKGARECVQKFTGVQKGEPVLIITETTDYADPLAIQAISLAADEVGADVTVIYAKPFDPRHEEPPRIVENAMYTPGSTIITVIPHFAFIHAKAAVRAMFEYDCRVISLCYMEGGPAKLLASEFAKFPTEVYRALVKKNVYQTMEGKTWRVTSPNGTDISGEIHPLHITTALINIEPGPWRGCWSAWPAGTVGFHPEGKVEGVIVYDVLEGFSGILKTPVKMMVEDHWVTRVEGGPEAEWFWNLLKKHKNGNYLAEVMWGIHPKASLSKALESPHLDESSRRSSTLHFGVGKSTTMGGPIWSTLHWDGLLLKPTLYLGNEKIIDNGKYLTFEDPEIIENASKYGDPKEILAEIP